MFPNVVNALIVINITYMGKCILDGKLKCKSMLITAKEEKKNPKIQSHMF